MDKEVDIPKCCGRCAKVGSSHPSSMPEPMQRILNSKATSPTNPESSSGSNIPTILLDPPRVGSSSLGDIIPAAYESISPERLFPIADKLQETFKSGEPFPHVVIDGLFPTELLRNVAMELPDFAMPAEQQCPDNFQCHENEGTSRKLASESEHEWGEHGLLLPPQEQTVRGFRRAADWHRFLLVDAMKSAVASTHPEWRKFAGAPANRLTARYQLDRRVNVFLYLNELDGTPWGQQAVGSLHDDAQAVIPPL